MADILDENGEPIRDESNEIVQDETAASPEIPPGAGKGAMAAGRSGGMMVN